MCQTSKVIPVALSLLLAADATPKKLWVTTKSQDVQILVEFDQSRKQMKSCNNKEEATYDSQELEAGDSHKVFYFAFFSKLFFSLAWGEDKTSCEFHILHTSTF